MDDYNEKLPVREISVWNRELGVDFNKLFKAVSGGLVSLKLGKYDSAVKSALEAVTSVKLKDDPGLLAYSLIWRSLTKVLMDLAKDSLTYLSPPQDFDQKQFDFIKDLPFDFERKDLTIDASFFQNPAQLPLLEDVKSPFIMWLINLGLEAERATTVTNRLQSYFVLALDEQWRTRSGEYLPLQQYFDSPFTKATGLERDWLSYTAYLEELVNQPVFGVETFSLKDIHVKLRAGWEILEEDEETELKAREQIIRGRDKKKINVVMIQEHLEAWIDNPDKNDALRVVTGGPGSGKSSFSKIFAARLTQDQKIKVLYIPLHLFDMSGDLVDCVGKFSVQTRLFRQNPLDSVNENSRLLIIFDGLDELPMLEKVALDNAGKFIGEVKNKLNLVNHQCPCLQVIITGRTVIVQANRLEFRKIGQILHLLPYYITDGEYYEYKCDSNILSHDQRDEWWNQYSQFTGNEYKKMPRALRTIGKRFDEITAQPLLNFLVALSFIKDKIVFDKQTKLNQIYENLIARVYDRPWDRREWGLTSHLESKKDYLNVLMEIAMAAWHGEGRSATVEQIEKRCPNNLLNSFCEEAKSGVLRLLTAFYFQEQRRVGGAPVFEFTHKSFQEYLTALKLVNELKVICGELTRHDANPYVIRDEKAALKKWAELCGPTAIDRALWPFIRDQVQLEDASDVLAWQEILVRLINWVLHQGMPMEMFCDQLSYKQMDACARNAEEALIVFHYACALVTENISQIDWPEPTVAGQWIKRLQGQRAGTDNRITHQCLGYLDLSNTVLDMCDLYSTNLSYSRLQETEAVFSIFVGAILKGAYLVEANLEGANLVGANMAEANLERSILIGADLRMASLKWANLEGVNLERANLEGANLVGVDLERANLDGANLCGANVNRANFLCATLVGANINGANLKNVNLARAILIGANIERSNLEGANLERADLKRADFRGANLEWADLEGANLEGANLEGANMVGVNLVGANLKGANMIGVNVTGANLIAAKRERTDPLDSEGLSLHQLIEAQNPEKAILPPDLKKELDEYLAEKKKQN